MKKHLYLRCAGIILFLLFASKLASAQSAQLSGNPYTIPADMFGYNVNTIFNGPRWNDTRFRFSVGRLVPGNLRYPGGTISNYWDWKAGNVMKTINKGFPKYFDDRFNYTPDDFIKGIPSGTSVVYCINMARPTPATGISPYSNVETLRSQATLNAKMNDIMNGLRAWQAAGHSLRYIELGNEFYIGAKGGVDGQGSIYSGNVGLYINHANQIAARIKRAYPQAKIGVIGEDNRKDSQTATPWTRAIYNAIKEGRLRHIDAITFHWYSGPGTQKLQNAQDAMRSLAQSFNAGANHKRRDYDNLPNGLDIWVTEYNTFSPPGASNDPNNPGFGGPIQGTWTNGLFGANLAMLYTAMGANVTMLNVHVISVNNNLQWNMIQDADNLSGNGVAFAALGSAMKGMDRAQRLRFNNIPNATFSNGRPSLHGLKFFNNALGQSAVVIINSTNQAKNQVNIERLFAWTGNRRMAQYYDTTPWNKNLSELQGIQYNYNPQLGSRVNLPPFSITVIRQDRQNLVKNASFEIRGTENWISDGPATYARKNAYEGNHALFLERTTKGWQSARQRVQITPNRNYRFSGMIRTQLTNGIARLHARFFDAAGKEVGQRLFGKEAGGERAYQQVSLTFRTPANAKFVDLYVHIANGQGRIWFDEAKLVSLPSGSRIGNEPFLGENLSTTVNTVYPNPATKEATILLGRGFDANASLQLYTLQGKAVDASLYTTIEDGEAIRIGVSRLPKGFYALQIAGSRGAFETIRLAVE